MGLLYTKFSEYLIHAFVAKTTFKQHIDYGYKE